MATESPWQRDLYNCGKPKRIEPKNPFDDARRNVERQLADSKKSCRLCGESYFPRNNLGSLQCRYHPGAYGYDYWSCCKQPIPNLPGCVMCDHISMDDKRSEYDLWPESLLFKTIPKQDLKRFQISRWTIVKPVNVKWEPCLDTSDMEELVAVGRVQRSDYKRPYAIYWIGGR